MVPGDYVTTSIRLVHELTVGGMGAIWLAEHERLRMPVVVKFVVGELSREKEVLALFEREASLVALSKSPHVVQILDHGVAPNGTPYIAMERLVGEDLERRIQREGRIDPAAFVDIFRQAAAGVGRAHERGVVHRDIKPANLFLCDEDGEVLVKLLDFGIAKLASARSSFEVAQTGNFLGTAFYMSPEQAMSLPVDHRSDLWALGVVAYQALTGARPFDAEAIGPLMVVIARGRFVPPSRLRPELGPAIDEWMQRALAVDPGQRFESAKQMASAFEQAWLRSREVADLSPIPPSTQVPLAVTVEPKPWSSTTLSPTLTSEWLDAHLPHRARWVTLLVVAAVAGFLATLAVTTGPPSTGERTFVAVGASQPVPAPPPPSAAARPMVESTAAEPSAQASPPRPPTVAKAPRSRKAPAVARSAGPAPAPEPRRAHALDMEMQ